MKILFVCGGNTCRSPIAAAITQRVLGTTVETDNGGIAPHGDSATLEAIAVTRDLFGIDLSPHRPHAVHRESLATYDYIVAMDSYVASRLRAEYGIPASRLIQWQIADPYLQGREAYERCARKIKSAVRALRDRLKEPQSRPGKPERTVPDFAGESLREAITRLRQDVERWQRELSQGEVRGTTMHGIAKKAVDTFETILRQTVGSYRAFLADDEPGEKNTSSGKPFEKLTLGELIQYLNKNNKRLTAAIKEDPEGSQRFKSRTLAGPVRRYLDKISVCRNALHHKPDEFAPDIERLQTNTKHLLCLLSKVLADA